MIHVGGLVESPRELPLIACLSLAVGVIRTECMTRRAVFAILPRVVVAFLLTRPLAHTTTSSSLLVAAGAEVEVYSRRDGEPKGCSYAL